LKLVTAILAASIRMEDQARFRVPPEPRHAQRIGHQAGLHVGCHAPAGHVSAMQVDYSGQVQPTLIGGDVGNVTGPHGVGLRGLEVAIQQIGCNGQVVLAVSGNDIPALASGFNAVQFHQFLDTVFSDAHALGHKFFPDPGPAVFAFTARVGCFDVRQHGFVAELPARL